MTESEIIQAKAELRAAREILQGVRPGSREQAQQIIKRMEALLEG